MGDKSKSRAISYDATAGERWWGPVQGRGGDEMWIEVRHIFKTEPKELAGAPERCACKRWWQKKSNQDGKTWGKCLTSPTA